MGKFYIKLIKAKDIKRDKEGYPVSWTGGEDIKTFTDPEVCRTYIKENLHKLDNAVFFTGSASLIVNANTYLADQLKAAGLV